jgi:hypothetical protein
MLALVQTYGPFERARLEGRRRRLDQLHWSFGVQLGRSVRHKEKQIVAVVRGGTSDANRDVRMCELDEGLGFPEE